MMYFLLKNKDIIGIYRIFHCYVSLREGIPILQLVQRRDFCCFRASVAIRWCCQAWSLLEALQADELDELLQRMTVPECHGGFLFAVFFLWMFRMFR